MSIGNKIAGIAFWIHDEILAVIGGFSDSYVDFRSGDSKPNSSKGSIGSFETG